MTAIDHVFVLGLDRHGRDALRRLPGADRFELHPLFGRDEVRGVEEFPVDEWLREAQHRIDASGVAPSGVMTYWDFPVTEMAAIVAAARGLPAPGLGALVRTQHKLVARQLQRRVVPEAVPAFQAVDVRSDDSLAELALPFPFWLKPVRSFRSHLGFRVRSKRDLAQAVAEQRDGLDRLVRPYQDLLRCGDVPEPIALGDAGWSIAEAIVSGRQCTLEGWVRQGEVQIYGAVDSVRAPNRSSFARYVYPSSLPAEVLARMTDLAERFVRASGLDESAFNVELFWDRRHDHLWLLELNARASQSHFDLFEHVDGVSSALVPLQVALGRRPDPPWRAGRWAVAAKCFLRAYADAYVTSAPGPERIAEVEASIPGVSVRLDVGEGDQLSLLPDQDAYSFELGHVIVPGTSPRHVTARFAECRARLGIELTDVVP